MHDYNGFLKYTVIYYYLDIENCHHNDNCIEIYHNDLFLSELLQSPKYLLLI